MQDLNLKWNSLKIKGSVVGFSAKRVYRFTKFSRNKKYEIFAKKKIRKIWGKNAKKYGKEIIN